MLSQKILVVDDERPLSELIAEVLRMEGYSRVEKAFNGLEGLEKYKVFLPDLVIMDIDMPVMDGYESSIRIKSYDPGARILVLTGNAGDSRARRTVEEGLATTLLQKPVGLKRLRNVIQENLSLQA